MNQLVTSIYNKKDWLSKQTWIVPLCFGFSCFLTVLSVVVLAVRGFKGLEPEWMFSIGADIICMAICTMLCFSATLNRKARNADTHVFLTMLTTNAAALFLDEMCWIVQGIPAFKTVNLTVNVLFYMLGSVLIYLFWEYIRRALRLYDKPMKIADTFVTAMLYPSLLLCLVNFVYPLFFKVGDDGVYQRAAHWDVSQVYMSITLTVVIIAIIFAKASAKDRLVAISFIAIPLVNQIITAGCFGLSTQYAAMLVSIVLIWGVLFAEREKALASTEMELGVATKIQSAMLPNTFPFMPERPEFDLYASMTPAKEVGGDFYDFFMVDDNRLALGRAAVNAEVLNANPNMFMNPGENLQFCHLGDYTLIAIDSGNGEPYKAIANLAYIFHTDKAWDRSRTIIFSHKPFNAANLYHKFMGNNCLDFDVGRHLSRYAARYFCGHWHHYTSSRMTSLDGEFSLTVCPGIQCQIDPSSEKCNAVALPGYMIITCGGSPQVTYEVRFIDNWKDEQTDN